MRKKNRNPIILGVDLDEVVFRYLDGLKGWMCENDMWVPSGEPASWSLAESGWFDSLDEFRKVHGDAVEDGLYERLETIEGAADTIRDLSHSGYKINVITSRFVNPGQHQKVVAQTVKALDENRILYSNLSFLHDKTLQLADAYIDDSPSNITNLTEADRFVIAMDMRYNKSTKSAARAKDWVEVREILRDRFGR